MRHAANLSMFRGHLSLAAVTLLAWTLTATAQSRLPSQPVSTPDVRPPAGDVALALQRKYDAIKDFSASFMQTYEGGVLRRKASESGTVYVKKPGRMRWDYTAPEKKLFVSDGHTMFLYFPADKQVMTSPVRTAENWPSAMHAPMKCAAPLPACPRSNARSWCWRTSGATPNHRSPPIWTFPLEPSKRERSGACAASPNSSSRSTRLGSGIAAAAPSR